jgi:adenosylcobalamin-dependent ribonucleoside-triphosphate reductase
VQLSVRLPEHFLAPYAQATPFWGFTDAGGNSLGELAFVRSYSRKKEDSNKERWWEVCRRVIEGMYHEQKRWCLEHQILWDDEQGLESAMEAYDHMYHRRWAPPGRGLTVMGTPLVHEMHDSTPLQNCAFISTSDHEIDDPGEVFAWMMEASMLGVGVGFDTLMATEGIVVMEPWDETRTYVIPDTREGWAESVRLLVNSYLVGTDNLEFDYSEVRPAGATIHTFGGTASGPGPLMAAHEVMRTLLDRMIGQTVDSRLVTDLMNVVGKAVVSGNVRRSAQIAMSFPEDKDFVTLKDWSLPENAERTARDGWSWASNNTVFGQVGMDYDPLLKQIEVNGEPGIAWMDITRRFGRLIDPMDNADLRAAGYNPCGEQPLESREMCTLVNVYPTNCESYEQYLRVLKFAYLYAKTVTLIPTRWAKTNSIMQRNRRIGTSFNGAWQFVERHGWPEIDKWMDSGYGEIKRWDEIYSEWLCVRESNRHTTVKPDGTGSLLAGVTPGAHPNPGGEFYLRRIRYGIDDALVPLAQAAGYTVEPAFGNEDTTVVIAFPIAGPVGVRSQADASVYEKIHLAARMQRYWSDNSVSLTLTYHPETETKELGHVLRMFEGQLKSISFLKIDSGQYPQMPYEPISAEQYAEYATALRPIDWSVLYGSGTAEAEGERFCSNDVCEIIPR